MKTKFTSKVFIFDKALKFKEAIFCVMGDKGQLVCIKKFLKLKYGQLQKHSQVFWIVLSLHVMNWSHGH